MQAKNTEEGLHNLNGFLTFTDYVGLGTGVGSIVGRDRNKYSRLLHRRR